MRGTKTKGSWGIEIFGEIKFGNGEETIFVHREN